MRMISFVPSRIWCTQFSATSGCRLGSLFELPWLQSTTILAASPAERSSRSATAMPLLASSDTLALTVAALALLRGGLLDPSGRLLVQLGEQPFAVPLSMVREILPIEMNAVQEVGGRATMVVRGDVMPVYPLSYMLGWSAEGVPGYGVLMQTAEQTFILAIDGFMGREDAVIKSLDDFRPKGVAGVTTLSNGQIVLILDMKELLASLGEGRGVPRSTLLPPVADAA